VMSKRSMKIAVQTAINVHHFRSKPRMEFCLSGCRASFGWLHRAVPGEGWESDRSTAE
jgi:hypothetical protein